MMPEVDNGPSGALSSCRPGAAGSGLFSQIGLVVNVSAGAGAGGLVLERALEVLRPERVVTGPGQLGAAFLDPARWRVSTVKPTDQEGPASTQALAHELAEAGVPVIVVVGGDGTLADVAAAIGGRPGAPAVCGIGVGSMSVGQLVAFRATDLDMVDPRSLAVCSVAALEATVRTARGRLSGMAFNDVVFATTLVGTLGERLCDLDAAAFLAGERRASSPQPVGRSGTVVTRIRVARRGRPHADDVALTPGWRVGGIAVGFTSPSYVGKAITGGACLGSWAGLPAGCLVSDVPLARVDLGTASVLRMRPIRSCYVSLSASHRLVVEGVKEGTAVLADGNPISLLSGPETVEVAVRPNALRAVAVARPGPRLRCAGAPGGGGPCEST